MIQALQLKHRSLDYSLLSPQAIERFLDGETIEPLQLYLDIRAYVNRFVYFTDDRYLDLLTTWCMGTYLFPVFRHYPYLWLNAEKGSGKTTVLEIIRPICFNGQMLVSPTPAVLFREVSANRVTLLIDEFEGMTKQNKENASAIFDILNAGYNREGQVKRTEPSPNGDYRVRTFSAYSPKIFSGIKEIDNVLRDRTIQVRMLRKGVNDQRARYKVTQEVEALQQELRDRCYIFSLSYASRIAESYHSGIVERKILGHLSNRELDLWEPLVSILYTLDHDDVVGLMQPIVSLSQQSFEEKSTDDMVDSDTSKIIVGLKALLESDLEFKQVTENGLVLRVYKAPQVVAFLQRNFGFDAFQLDQRELSTRLKGLHIIVKQRREGQERHMTYAFSSEQVDELINRFNVQDT